MWKNCTSKTGGKGFEKYILANGKMLSPQDFEAMGDKKKIKHGRNPLSIRANP